MAPRIVIVGGGIGGLAAAIAVRQAGMTPIVCERGRDLASLQRGGGYTLWYPAVRALQELGVIDRVHASGRTLERFEFWTRGGRLLARFPIGVRGRELGAQPTGVLRGELHDALAREVGSDSIRFGAECVGVRNDATSAAALLANGEEVAGDALVAADGIRSRVRAELHGEEAPRYPGYGHWFGFVEDGEHVAPPDTFRIVFASGMRFGLLPVGGGRICWWCTMNAPEGGFAVEPGIRGRLQAAFDRWPHPIGELLAATDEAAIGRRDTYDLKPLSWWGRDRTTLLGDAAHAMTFDLGLGASTTLKDGVILGRILKRSKDVVSALRWYEDERMPRANQLVRRSASIGAMAAWRNPAAARLHQGVLALGRYVFIGKQYEQDLDFRISEAVVPSNAP